MEMEHQSLTAEQQTSQKMINTWFLGATSKKYESTNGGPGTISTGKHDHGGASYGTYQLSSKAKTINDYLRETNNYNGAFDGLTPTTPAFDKKWYEIAGNDTENFNNTIEPSR